ncbi:endo-1,4-beta-xylanase [Sporothrix schenckii 1099-18]|uniref:Endo-1,4-beta-xylanase n=2 Tax=Sporothrix schenckii TaxID=29908 RepID=U7Q3B8_SPOS1|nr:endo-1,4-beta-xylanase [Sporothrix schenckii 1099-18]ERT01677.1 hypothetical protein HMPREF1624_02929 [Sporothrix schenckii ATCC 58251]KJR88908.1 endo-1,4-beta-xylanase [Sporothrix schenckii 1099-18]
MARLLLVPLLLAALAAVPGAHSAAVFPQPRDVAVPGTLETTDGIDSTDGTAAASYTSSYWNDGTATVKYTNGPNGQYSVTWSGDKGNFVAGKGWNGAPPAAVNYSGTFEPKGNAYLSMYGWTTNPLVEYYIVESYGTHKPCSSPSDEATQKGNVTVDGSTYEIWTKIRRNKPSIQGTATFPQFFSIRTDRRVGGTVHTDAHFKAFAAGGLKMGTQKYMIVATEGQDSSGTASIDVGVAPAAAA